MNINRIRSIQADLLQKWTQLNQIQRNLMSIFGVALVVIVLVASSGFVSRDDEEKSVLSKKEQSIQDIVTLVSKIFLLPEGEEPVMATIKDTEKLKDQQFFAHAQLGDKVLIYNTAKKAVLYRPSEHRVIDVTILNITTGSPSPVPIQR